MIKKILNNKVFKNFSYLTIGSGIAQLISLFTILKITRLLAPDDYGVFTFMVMQGTLLYTIGDLGIRNIVIRSIARDPERTNDLVLNGAVLRAGAVLILSILYIGYNHLFGSLDNTQLLLVFAFSLVNCFSHLFENAYLGHEKMLMPALVNLGYSISWFAAVFMMPAETFNIMALFYVFLALNTVRAIIYFVLLKFQGLLIGRVLNFWESSRKLLSESWPYFAFLLVWLPFSHFSNNFLDINSTSEEVGYFNLSQKLLGPVSLVMDFALAAIFPNLSALWAKDQERFKNILREGFQYFMLLALVLTFMFTLFARDVVNLLFPASYMPAVFVCQLQIWFLFLNAIDSFIGAVWGATDNEKVLLRLGIIFSVLATPILFYGSKFGALGLSYAYVGALAVWQFYLFYVFRKVIKVRFKKEALLWTLTVVLFLVSYFFPVDASIFYKIMLALGVLGGIAYYFLKTYKKVALR